MDDLRVGTIVRAVRRRRGLRQADVARLAAIGQSTVSEIERGQLESLCLRTIRSVCSVLEIRLQLEPSWRGGQLARLLDSRHATAVERVVDLLVPLGWEISPEYTFSVFGERGSVDVLAWRPGERALLIIEVKTEIDDVQDLLSTLHRKSRLVPGLVATERGWRVETLGVVVVLCEGGSARDALARHRATFAASLPHRTVEVRRWISRPGAAGLRGVWILRLSGRGNTTHGRGGPRRIRVPRGMVSAVVRGQVAPDSRVRRPG